MKNRIATDEGLSPKLELIYKLGGRFPEGMDVASLCPMLIGIADLIKASNNTILATEKEIAVMVKPFKLPNVTQLETYLPTSEAQTKVHLEKADASLLENLTPSAPPDSTTNAHSENKHLVWVNPRTGNYEGEPTSSSFRKIGDSTAFHARLTDENFLNKLKSGEVRLSAKDALRVELVEAQDVETDKISRSISKVVEYRRAPVQALLP
jgi:hypothetical protein